MAKYEEDDYAEMDWRKDTFEDHHEIIPSKISQDDYVELIPNKYNWIDDNDAVITKENTYARHHPRRASDDLVYAPAPKPEILKKQQINPLKHRIISKVAIAGYCAWVAIKIFMVIKYQQIPV